MEDGLEPVTSQLQCIRANRCDTALASIVCFFNETSQTFAIRLVLDYFKLHLGEVLVVRLTLPAAAALGQADEAMPEEESGDSHGRADHEDRNQGHDVLLGPMHKNQGH